ncbi:MAG TPA: hypothetical protein VIE39_09420, partial [Thermoanaerobaculia bacterium]
QIWFFLTPIVYHVSIVPVRLRPPIWINPLYYLVQTFRDPIYKGMLPEPRVLAASLVLAVGVFVTGWVFFANRSDRYAMLS